MLEILTRITKGEGREGDIETPDRRWDRPSRIQPSAGWVRPAPIPVLSTINHFRHEYEAHIRDKFCPAGACEALVFAPCENTCPVRCDAVGYTALISARKVRRSPEPDPADHASGRDLRPGL